MVGIAIGTQARMIFQHQMRLVFLWFVFVFRLETLTFAGFQVDEMCLCLSFMCVCMLPGPNDGCGEEGFTVDGELGVHVCGRGFAQ